MKLEELLAIGQNAISNAKGLLPYGAGNIIEDIVKSGSESLGRSDYARNLCNEGLEAVSSEPEGIFMRAAAAKIAQGGNCHEYAALVFAKLMETTKGLQIQMCKQRMAENFEDYHVFVRILMTGNRFVFVDAWGSNKLPLVVEDGGETEEIIVIYEAITSEDATTLKKCESIIKNTMNFNLKQTEIADAMKTGINCYKAKDNLQYLEQDKYIGGRCKRAYNDPGL